MTLIQEFEPVRKTEIARIAKEAIENRVFPGCVIGVVKNGQTSVLPFGALTYDGGALVQKDSVYDVASVTKAIPTACLALHFIDKGEMSLDDLVKRFIPELRGAYSDQIQIRHLLTDSLEFQTDAAHFSLSAIKNEKPDDILQAIYRKDLKSPPGVAYQYTNAASILLGLAVEAVGGQRLDLLSEGIFFDPLGMERTTFYPLKRFSATEIAPTEIDEAWRQKTIQGEPHDESTYALQMGGYTPGAAGLFSTAPNLLIFVRMLLNGGAHQDRQYFSEGMVDKMFSNHFKSDFTLGLGWDMYPTRYMSDLCGEGTVGKTGFTGSLIALNRKKDTGVVVLSNTTYPTRKENSDAMTALRKEITGAVF